MREGEGVRLACCQVAGRGAPYSHQGLPLCRSLHSCALAQDVHGDGTIGGWVGQVRRLARGAGALKGHPNVAVLVVKHHRGRGERGREGMVCTVWMGLQILKCWGQHLNHERNLPPPPINSLLPGAHQATASNYYPNTLHAAGVHTPWTQGVG